MYLILVDIQHFKLRASIAFSQVYLEASQASWAISGQIAVRTDWRPTGWEKLGWAGFEPCSTSHSMLKVNISSSEQASLFPKSIWKLHRQVGLFQAKLLFPLQPPIMNRACSLQSVKDARRTLASHIETTSRPFVALLGTKLHLAAQCFRLLEVVEEGIVSMQLLGCRSPLSCCLSTAHGGGQALNLLLP